MQVFYAIIAIFLLALLSLTVMRSTQRLDSRIYVNEVVTQASGVATGIIETIGRKPFDSKTDTTKVSTFPAVTSTNQLTSEANFGGCTNFSLCEDIDDFNGLVITRLLNGFEFTATITIKYVSPVDPDYYTGTQTFAKEVLVEITSPYLYVGSRSNPITVPFRRIFSYQKATSA